MNDLYNDSNFWRIFINVVGGVSILVALFLIYIAIKKIRHLIKGNRVKVLKDIYVTIYELPSNELKNKVQFGFELPITTQLTFSIIDKSDKVLHEIHSGELNKGPHVFLFDSTQLENGNYFLNYSSTIQTINRKIIINN